MIRFSVPITESNNGFSITENKYWYDVIDDTDHVWKDCVELGIDDVATPRGAQILESYGVTILIEGIQ